jgi:hypothetical protein
MLAGSASTLRASSTSRAQPEKFIDGHGLPLEKPAYYANFWNRFRAGKAKSGTSESLEFPAAPEQTFPLFALRAW